MFVKMYFEARDSGLLAAIPDELWKTPVLPRHLHRREWLLLSEPDRCSRKI